MQSNNQEQQLMRDVQLGLDAEAFLNSKLGQYLQSRADEDLENGVKLFLHANPADVSQMIQIQVHCKVAMNFKQWLLEAINAGQYAEMELKDHVD